MTEEIKLPGGVRVGCLDYMIENWNSQDANSSGKYGEHSSLTQRIRVDTQFGPVRTAKTLLHEILHACCHQGGYCAMENPTEEQTVSQFSDMLMQVWRDNPELIKWISKHAGTK